MKSLALRVSKGPTQPPPRHRPRAQTRVRRRCDLPRVRRIPRKTGRCRNSTVSRQISTPAEASSIRLSTPNASSVIERAATPAPIATAASMTIQATVNHSRRKAFRTSAARASTATVIFPAPDPLDYYMQAAIYTPPDPVRARKQRVRPLQPELSRDRCRNAPPARSAHLANKHDRDSLKLSLCDARRPSGK